MLHLEAHTRSADGRASSVLEVRYKASLTHTEMHYPQVLAPQGTDRRHRGPGALRNATQLDGDKRAAVDRLHAPVLDFAVKCSTRALTEQVRHKNSVA